MALGYPKGDLIAHALRLAFAEGECRAGRTRLRE